MEQRRSGFDSLHLLYPFAQVTGLRPGRAARCPVGDIGILGGGPMLGRRVASTRN